MEKVEQTTLVLGNRYFQMNVEQSEEEEGLVEQKRNSLASINY